MLVGAGNAYVAEAKRQLFGRVGIDLLAGPTEVAVIADATADPELVAADLLGQAEHGPTSPALLIATDAAVGAGRAGRRGPAARRRWPTAEVAGAAWRDHGTVLVAADDEEAAALADEHAPEHLEVQVAEAQLDWYRDAAARVRVALPRARGHRRLRRQGGRHEPRAADDARRALHGRAVGGEVPADGHLAAADGGGHRAGGARRRRHRHGGGHGGPRADRDHADGRDERRPRRAAPRW